MKVPAFRLALALTLLTAGRGLAAQEIPAFHAGEWAAEFTGGNWNNAGVMRFFSPRSALVLSASGSFSRSTATPDGGVESTSTSRALFLALGVRRHNAVASRVLATTELGAELDLNRVKTRTDAFGGPIYRQRQTNYGIYGEIGGQYFVASHLALGAVASVNLTRSTGRSESGGPAVDVSGFSLSTGLRPIRVTLYF